MLIHRNIGNILTDDDYGIQGEYLVSIGFESESTFLDSGKRSIDIPLVKENLVVLWQKIPQIFEHVQVKECFISDNKFYGIICIDIYGRKGAQPIYSSISQLDITVGLVIAQKNPYLVEGSLFHIINWFKAASLAEIKKSQACFLWQSGYDEFKFNLSETVPPIRELVFQLN
ncbi:hypothetical protein RCC89_01445 [Cytophagaceae bacterium ABcell3]|nr:hypothetical protein RCC89_01445 [Cytophagaceae bacterium ABcell3]